VVVRVAPTTNLSFEQWGTVFPGAHMRRRLGRPLRAALPRMRSPASRAPRAIEPAPASIALDHEYMTELQRREALTAFPGTPPRSLEEMRAEILQAAQQPILEGPPPPPDVKAIEAECREQQQESALR
jgi:hypothetical protein